MKFIAQRGPKSRRVNSDGIATEIIIIRGNK
jgi:hypothetical protein